MRVSLTVQESGTGYPVDKTRKLIYDKLAEYDQTHKNLASNVVSATHGLNINTLNNLNQRY